MNSVQLNIENKKHAYAKIIFTTDQESVSSRCRKTPPEQRINGMNKIKQPPISLPCRLRGVTSHSVIVQHGEGIGGFLITPMTDEERKERQKASKMKWRAANPEKRKATKDKWRSANPDKVREQNRRYRAANREKVRDQKRKYREANRAKVCEQIGQSGADVVGGNLGIDNRRKSSIIRP